MATISAAGIGSGLDINSIVAQLVAIEREPISRLKTAATKIESQISAFGRLKGALAKLRDTSAAFTTPAPWTGRLAVSADPNTFDARITGAGVIAGWSQGVPGMRIGGLRRLVIPPELAYGNSTPDPSRIPPGATLLFEVELVSVP